MGFQKPTESKKRLKALVYGPTGCGKTITGLQFPNPAVIDGERGTEHYGDHFNYVVDYTSSCDALMSNVSDLMEDPGDIKTLMIDPMTAFMDNLQTSWTRKLQLKKGNPDYELQPADHGPLKQRRKEIIDKILSLDMNIVCTAKIKAKYKKVGSNFMTPDGWKPDLPEEVPYMFDTIIRIEISEDGETRIAHCEKDRTNKLPKTFEFTYDQMVEYLGIDSLTRDVDLEYTKNKLDEEKKRLHEITYQGQKIKTAGITEDTMTKILKSAEEADIDEDGLKKMLQEQFSYPSLLDLKEDEGKFLINYIETL